MEKSDNLKKKSTRERQRGWRQNSDQRGGLWRPEEAGAHREWEGRQGSPKGREAWPTIASFPYSLCSQAPSSTTGNSLPIRLCLLNFSAHSYYVQYLTAQCPSYSAQKSMAPQCLTNLAETPELHTVNTQYIDYLLFYLVFDLKVLEGKRGTFFIFWYARATKYLMHIEVHNVY